MTKPLLIGMPVYNGERFLSKALDSLLNQSFTDWTLLISDNASGDNTSQICQSYCSKESRIKYYRQPENIGAIKNFKYLLESANSEYFMWAAADDEWDPIFIETCVKGLTDTQFDWAFSNIVNIDSFGHVIREYPSFSVFAKGETHLRIAQYVLAPEIYGKANLIYSIYRLRNLKPLLSTLLTSPEANIPGYDMIINLAVLCHANLFIDERVLFRKRFAQDSDIPQKANKVTIDLPILRGTMGEDFNTYQQVMVNSVRGTEFEELVRVLMESRKLYQKDLMTLHNDYQALVKDRFRWAYGLKVLLSKTKLEFIKTFKK